MKMLWSSGLGKISKSLPIGIPYSRSNSPNHTARSVDVTTKPSIAFVLSLAGRFQTFLRFIRNYETVCLSQSDENTDLLVVMFREQDNDLMPYYNELEKLSHRYPNRQINHITLNGNFSRGIALNEATHSPLIRSDQIIFFIDVDITFNQLSLDRIRVNTIKQRQVYLPIVFSEYNPHRDNVTLSELGQETGYFRQFGYGICSIYKMDVLHPNLGGFNTDITGWGLEDVKFLERIVKLNQKPTAMMANTADIGTDDMKEAQNQTLTLAIFRSADPSLVHVYHDIFCDKSLNEAQYQMCLGTKANTLGSYKYIESQFVNNRTLVEYVAGINEVS